MSYCTREDLLVGSIPLPSYVDAGKYIANAAEEINSRLSAMYVTPIVVPVAPQPPEVDTHYITRVALKRINASLASGRIITAAAAGGEDTDVHAYGYMLLRQASEAIDLILSGRLTLPGVPLIPSLQDRDKSPLITNGDPYSQVDAFYAVATPGAVIVDPMGIQGQYGYLSSPRGR